MNKIQYRRKNQGSTDFAEPYTQTAWRMTNLSTGFLSQMGGPVLHRD